METSLTHVTVVLDRTGSMDSIRDDVIGGFNAFLAEQQALPGRATLSLVQFDSQDPFEVLFEHLPMALVRPLTRETFVPRASTPLYDALGRAIVALDAQLLKLGGAAPARVVVAVVTDGQENASHEFTRDRVRQLIAEKKQAGWHFLFLSADESAFADAGAMGVAMESRMAFDADAAGTKAAFSAKSRMVRSLRAGEAAPGFTDDERRSGKPG